LLFFFFLRGNVSWKSNFVKTSCYKRIKLAHFAFLLLNEPATEINNGAVIELLIQCGIRSAVFGPSIILYPSRTNPTKTPLCIISIVNSIVLGHSKRKRALRTLDFSRGIWAFMLGRMRQEQYRTVNLAFVCCWSGRSPRAIL
jgi:hypothetical protein